MGVECTLRSSPSLISLTGSSCSSGSMRRLKVSLAEEPSYGALDAYPLKRSSVLCKATGGGRWEPKQEMPLAGARLPGGKAGYEIRLEKEAEKERRRRENPVIKDGGMSFLFYGLLSFPHVFFQTFSTVSLVIPSSSTFKSGRSVCRRSSLDPSLVYSYCCIF